MEAETLEVADTIRKQLGRKALFMLGAKDLMGSAKERFLQFKIGRNAKSVSHIRITLTPADTYTVTSYRARRSKGVMQCKTLETYEDVYVDSLHQVIESLTGMYTSL
jgi:hypothetical protein